MPPKVGCGTAAVIISTGPHEPSVLMIQRKGSHGAGTWSFPGGWIEQGETISEAAERETREEVGLEVLACKEIDYTEDQHPEGIQDICFFVYCLRVEPTTDPEICEPEKIADWEWIPLRKLPFFEKAYPDRKLFMPVKQFFQMGNLAKVKELLP